LDGADLAGKPRVSLSDHARSQLTRRGLAEAAVLEVAGAPEQRLTIRPGREIRQSRISTPEGATLYLLRVVVDIGTEGDRGYGIPHQQDREILEQPMRVSYDEKTDTLTVVFRDVPVAESDEDKTGVILDYDAAGNIVSIEVLDASRRVEEPRRVILETED